MMEAENGLTFDSYTEISKRSSRIAYNKVSRKSIESILNTYNRLNSTVLPYKFKVKLIAVVTIVILIGVT